MIKIMLRYINIQTLIYQMHNVMLNITLKLGNLISQNAHTLIHQQHITKCLQYQRGNSHSS